MSTETYEQKRIRELTEDNESLTWVIERALSALVDDELRSSLKVVVAREILNGNADWEAENWTFQH